jgi:UDP-glucose 4-epimerase
MKILVTGSAGHLGEALMRSLKDLEHEALGLDIKSSPFTQRVGSITERGFVERCMQGVDMVLHAATLHKPHVASHTRQDFVDTNITGTLNLLEEEVTPVAKNIYGVTKLAAEHLCELLQRRSGLPCIVLRTSRFFPEDDDEKMARLTYGEANLKVKDAPSVVRKHVPYYENEYRRRGWSMLPAIDRVYVNQLARAELGWRPRYDFRFAVDRLRVGDEFRSPLAQAVGFKGYQHPSCGSCPE